MTIVKKKVILKMSCKKCKEVIHYMKVQFVTIRSGNSANYGSNMFLVFILQKR